MQPKSRLPRKIRTDLIFSLSLSIIHFNSRFNVDFLLIELQVSAQIVIFLVNGLVSFPIALILFFHRIALYHVSNSIMFLFKNVMILSKHSLMAKGFNQVG
jgi:hypothetical protein